jgi:hypothetical protein
MRPQKRKKKTNETNTTPAGLGRLRLAFGRGPMEWRRGDVIPAGTPWQAWRVPSREEIAAAEAKAKTANGQP